MSGRRMYGLHTPRVSWLNTQRYQVFALGGLVEYNFGPASFSVWATQEVYAKASGAAASQRPDRIFP